MKISIIIPIYNKESYLDQCLKSLQNQTHKDIEVICVDDGSTDSSLQILERYAKEDHRIKVFAQENSGTLIARKVGVSHSTGDYIMFLDPDDWYEETACEDMLVSIIDQDADVVLGGYIFEGDVDSGGVDIDYFDYYFNACLRRRFTFTQKDILRQAFISYEIPTPQTGKIFKSCIVKSAFELIPSIRCVFAEDQGTAFFIFDKINKTAFLDKKIYHYRIGVGISTQTKYTLQKFVDCLQSFDMLAAIKNYVETKTEEKEFLEELVAAIQSRMVKTAIQFTSRLEKTVRAEDWQQAFLAKGGVSLLVEEFLLNSDDTSKNNPLSRMIIKNRKHLKQVRILLVMCAALSVLSAALLFVLLNG